MVRMLVFWGECSRHARVLSVVGVLVECFGCIAWILAKGYLVVEPGYIVGIMENGT